MTIGVIVTSFICLYGILSIFVPTMVKKLNLIYDDMED